MIFCCCCAFIIHQHIISASGGFGRCTADCSGCNPYTGTQYEIWNKNLLLIPTLIEDCRIASRQISVLIPSLRETETTSTWSSCWKDERFGHCHRPSAAGREERGNLIIHERRRRRWNLNNASRYAPENDRKPSIPLCIPKPDCLCPTLENGGN